MSEPCAFDVCSDPATERVILTAGVAAGWALRPAILAELDRDLESEGQTHAIALEVCHSHAEGVRAAQFAARRGALSPTEERVLKRLQSQALAGGETIESLGKALRLAEGGLKKTIERMRRAGVVARSRYRGIDSRRHQVAKYIAVRQDEAPAPVQPTLGLEQ